MKNETVQSLSSAPVEGTEVRIEELERREENFCLCNCDAS